MMLENSKIVMETQFFSLMKRCVFPQVRGDGDGIRESYYKNEEKKCKPAQQMNCQGKYKTYYLIQVQQKKEGKKEEQHISSML